MHFGVPSNTTRKVKVEKYPELAVITLYGIKEKGTSRKIEFNKRAIELLELKDNDTNEIAFSLDPSNYNENYIINANEFDSGSNLKLGKNRVVSNKKHYNELKKRFLTEEEEDLELVLSITEKEYNNITLFKVHTMESLNTERTEDTIQEENLVSTEDLLELN